MSLDDELAAHKRLVGDGRMVELVMDMLMIEGQGVMFWNFAAESGLWRSYSSISTSFASYPFAIVVREARWRQRCWPIIQPVSGVLIGCSLRLSQEYSQYPGVSSLYSCCVSRSSGLGNIFSRDY